MKQIRFQTAFQFKAILLLSLLILNCNYISSKGNERDIIKVEFPKNPNNNLISDHLSLSNIVALETVDASLIRYIKKIIKHEDKFIVLNAGVEVLIFDLDGKFLNKINSRGTGPNEYNAIVDIAMDDNNENIIIYSDNYKLLFYDLMGNYTSQVNTIATDNIYERIVYDNNLIYFFNPLNKKDVNLIETFDLTNNEYKDNIQINKSKDLILSPMGVSIVRSKSIWYTTPLSNILSSIPQQRKYTIEIETFGVPENIIKMQFKEPNKFVKEVYSNNLCFGLSSIRETEQSIYFRSNKHDFIKLDKSNNKIEWMQIAIDSDNKIKFRNYFPHDADDNEIMFIANPDSFENLDLLIKNNPSAKQYIKNMHSEEINPILVFYKER